MSSKIKRKTLDHKPYIAVILGVWNMANTLERACSSILDQTFRDLHLFVIDDGSDDNPAEAIAGLLSSDERITFAVLQKKLGKRWGRSMSLNYGIGLAMVPGRLTKSGGERFTHIGIMDADDVSSSRRFEEELRLMKSKPELDLVSCWYRKKGEVKNNPVDHEEIVKALPGRPTLCHGGLLSKVEVYQSIGGYDERLQTCVDWDFYLRAWKKGFMMGNVPKVLYSILFGRNKPPGHRERYLEDLKYLREKHGI